MAVLRYNNGAWEEIEVLMKYANGAWAECDSAYKYTNGAWQEVWSNMISMGNELTYTLQNISWSGPMDYSNTFEGSSFWWYKEMDGADWGTIEGSGYWTVYAEGNWTDPIIEYEYCGGFRRTNSSYTTYYLNSAGTIEIYTKNSAGVENYSYSLTVGSSKSGTNGYIDLPEGYKSYQLSGTFTRIGFRLYEKSYSGTFYGADSQVEVRNVYIDGKPVTFKKLPTR